jgi:hypothetical protein
MGFVVNIDLETNLGKTEQMYCRIESFTFNKLTADLGFQITYWINRDACIKCSRLFIGDEIKNQSGLIHNKVISFENNVKGDEIVLEQFLVVKASKIDTVNIPILEKRMVSKEVPYISFDELGEEITAYRKVETEEYVEVGKKEETKEIIDYSLINNIYDFMYKKLREYLSNKFSSENIKKI